MRSVKVGTLLTLPFLAAAVIPHFSARQPTLPIHDCSAAAAGAKNAAPCVVDALYGERAAGAEVSRLDCNSSHKIISETRGKT